VQPRPPHGEQSMHDGAYLRTRDSLLFQYYSNSSRKPEFRRARFVELEKVQFTARSADPAASKSTRRRRMARFTVNGKAQEVNVDPNTPLLWVLREQVGLTGAKYGCGIAQCGACTVHVDGQPVRSCSLPVSEAEGKQVTTIEGLAQNGALHRVQQAWVDLDVPQCGYCQTGMIMAVAALLKDKPKPTDADIDREITNICRCGTFQQVRAAIHAAAASA
jgi:isoquinoline 1-oxidoreductase subunit alpha